MMSRRTTSIIVLFMGLFLGLAGVVYAAGNIDLVNKWAWGSNIGWLNFNPSHGGVTVYDDHLEGFAWAENIGWVRLGTHTGGGKHTYTNTTAANYGVNNDGQGNLSGYAWSSNAGWLNFNPSHSQVTIDPLTGEFAGYLWGENVGWIHLRSADLYGVVTQFRQGGQALYLPLLVKNFVVGPDLVVDKFAVSSNGITVTIRNAGDATVKDDFWVDLYIDPSEVPSVNKTWQLLSSHGAAWGVTKALLPQETLTLTLNGPYFDASESNVPPLPAGSQLMYILVDSVDLTTTYGAVQEVDETNNLATPMAPTVINMRLLDVPPAGQHTPDRGTLPGRLASP